ncbi:MAG: DHH family phosphoesterase [Bacillota bacterium]|nr:DHH family phosphoesterase [Bacillota bacterium]
MEKKLLKKTVTPVITIDFIVMLVMGVIILFCKKPYMYFGIGFIVLAGLVRVFHALFSEKTAKDTYQKLSSDLKQQVDEMTKAFSGSAPLLICLVDKNGRLYWSNDQFVEEFESQEAFDEKVGQKFINVFYDQPESVEEIVVDDKVFSVNGKYLQRHDGSMAKLLFWQNITARETIKQLYQDSRACMAIIDIDNYDELIESSPAEEQSTIVAEIDRAIHAFAIEMGASISKIKDSRYTITFEYKYIDKLRQEKFPILNAMHEIQTKADFPTTVSIGIGIGEPDLAALQQSAEDALDLAQARGGDQAVVRSRGGDIQYFGGTLPTVEKRNKGRSRVIAHQLLSAIEASDKVIIMGHANPDLDAFGSAMGMCSLCKNLNRPVAIVLDKPSEGIEEAFKEVASNKEWTFITHEQAEASITTNTLLILVDHHIQAMSEDPKLIDMATRIVVIDHHRKSANAIENAMLTHMEVYASSASELITEILQYAADKGVITKQVAEFLLAGIVLDTKNFTVNTGVRTFDAASFLKNKNADNKVVRGFFKIKLEAYQKKAALIANAEILSNGIAVAYTKDQDPSMQVICAQAADELLDMVGVEACFVAGRTEGKTTVSARSNGKINVQVIMEQLGGGGHQNVAAAQVDKGPEEAIAQIVNVMRQEEIL